MVRTGKSAGILSLSVASAALLQTATAQDEQSQNTANKDLSPPQNPRPDISTGTVFIEPAFQKNLNKLYADHTSHSSHASHSSHVSGVSGGAYVPYTPAPPAYQPAPQPAVVPQPTPPPAPAKVAPAWTNTVPVDNGAAKPDVSNEASKNALYFSSLKKQAAKGSADSQFILGLYYLHGTDGCETNIEKAKMLFELSALQGNTEAKEHLEQMQSAVQTKATP